ncbi:MAG: oxygen-independent coproporphyrinogen III oxidase [Deltaproteobacteria bacterium]|nr:oxygen-independent coproporphyrinogen III oxidase [Deltaproteobacteria bacterium]
MQPNENQPAENQPAGHQPTGHQPADSPFPTVDAELIAKLDRPAPRYTSYPTVPEWTERFGAADLEARLQEAGQRPTSEPLSLYVHIPFCEERCTFCGCNVVIAKDRDRADRYIDHLALEMAHAKGLLDARGTLSQLHFGGGTPTFLTEAQLERLMGVIRDLFDLLPDAEVAIEIDPCVTSKAKLTQLRTLGFNRVSMGVQDFEPSVQAQIHRVQTPEETEDLLMHARALGFGGVNFDLIYGLPGQTSDSWGRTLATVERMRPDRLAVYSFAYVPEARPHQKRLPIANIPLGAAKLNLFRQAYEAFVGTGYQHIGMDHFALPSDELSQAQNQRTLNRNFQGYTVKAATDVIAFGSSAISDVAGAYAQNVVALPQYYAAVAEGRFPVDRGIALSDDDKQRRAIIKSIMCNMWVDLDDYGGRAAFEDELNALRSLEEDRLVEVNGSQLSVTPLGRIFVRNVAVVFDAYAKKSGQHTFSRTV